MEGLRLWKRNIDKRFEGVEECMVCYAVVHGTNFQLPRVQCRTCKKKFHSACLVCILIVAFSNFCVKKGRRGEGVWVSHTYYLTMQSLLIWFAEVNEQLLTV